MITQIRHTGLVVANLQSALHFWCDILGFRIVKKMDESGPNLDAMMGLRDVKVTTVKLATPGGQMIELLHFKSHPDRAAWEGSPFSTGFTHVAMTVTDLQVCYEKLKSEGVIFYAPPQLSHDGAVKVTYGKGPEGVLLELVEMLKK
jgi:catechol 2,3-dioxygenase-like lactoylglutathione lyase family enzyme